MGSVPLRAACSCKLVADGCGLLPLATSCCYYAPDLRHFAILAPSLGPPTTARTVFPLSRNDGGEDADNALQDSMPLLHDSVA